MNNITVVMAPVQDICANFSVDTDGWITGQYWFEFDRITVRRTA